MLTSYQTKVENDYKFLESHSRVLNEISENLKSTTQKMQESIINLNEKGFSDSNFEKLNSVFNKNVENIQKVANSVQKLNLHIEGLTSLIKKYYQIQL